MIAMRRKEAKMTIDELVAKSGIPKGTLNKIIAGTTRDPQLETVKAIARALNCTLDDFDDTPRRGAFPQRNTSTSSRSGFLTSTEKASSLSS